MMVAWVALGLAMLGAVYLGFRLAGLVKKLTQKLYQKEKATQTALPGICLNDLTIDAIKVRLASHHRSAIGTKPVLIERLLVDEPWWRVV